MTSALRRSPWTPWAGLFAGAAGWFLHQQGGAGANYWDCRFGGPVWTVALGLVSAAIILAGGWISWSARRAPEGGEDLPGARRFGGTVGAVAALVFLFAVALQTLGGLIVPSCP